jgi:hypothetical protein
MHYGAYFQKSQVRLEGRSTAFARAADSGRKMEFHFCPTCGTTLYWNSEARPHHYGIAAGAFADPNFPPPTYSVWEESKHSWLMLPDEMESFEKAR